MNLLSKLHKNSVLTGPVESYCLACGCLLQSEEESYAHVQDPGHVDKLSTVPRLADYNDCILKSKEGYFCSYCNIILPTIKRVSLHIAESKHRENKNSQSITRHGDVILAFETVIISDRSWNGLDESTCSICNEDYDDEESHKQGATHVLNLIQTKCEFGETYVYRKVDEELFFCLICNVILPISEKPMHHESEKHLEDFQKSKKEGTAILSQKVPSSEPNNNSRTLPTSEPKHRRKQDTDEGKDIKHITQENNAQNGDQVIDNKPDTQKSTQETILNTESQASENFKSDSQNNKIVEITKQNTQENKLDSKNYATPEPKSKNEKDLSTKVQISKPESQNNENTIKDIPKQSTNTNAVTKDTEPKNSEAVKAKVDTEKPPKPVNNEVNGTAKVPTVKLESCLYQFLKDNDFAIKAQDDKAFCVLCDIHIDEPSITLHSRDMHHRILYAKHVARQSSQSSKNIETVNSQDNITDSKPSKTNKTNGQLKSKESKTNTAPQKENATMRELPNNQIAASQTDEKKPEAVTVKVVANVSNDTDKNTASVIKQDKSQKAVNDSIEKSEKPKEACNESQNIGKRDTQEDTPKDCRLTNKENTNLDNKNDDNKPICRSSNEQTKEESKLEPTESTIQHKKKSKKAHKKAAKAKATDTKASVLPKEVDETGAALTEVCGASSGETTTAEHRSLTANSSKALTDNLKSVNVDSKDSEKQHGLLPTEVKENETRATRFATGADLKTEKLLKILKTVSQVDNAPDDVVINAKYVLGNMSFLLVVRADNKDDCVACDEELTLDDIHKHITSDAHRSNVEECLVVTSLEDEFIRKMKTEKYHCGYCNILLPDWESMKSHLESYRHSDAKTSAAWRLERYNPHLKHCETREVRSILTAVFRCTIE